MILKKHKEVPLYLQIKELLKDRIKSGTLKDQKLPPVRKIAGELGVNPNTVLRAYNELSKEGLVSGTVGKGTYVTTNPADLKKQTRKEMLRKSIEHSLEEAMSLEFTIEEYEQAVQDYIREKIELMHNIRLAFIECNIEQLSYFTSHLELDPHIKRIPLLLDDIRSRRKDTVAEARRADIIVTSFYHLDEVRQFFGGTNAPIIGINLEPEITTLIEIAKIPSESTVGIITTSQQCRREIKDILAGANITFDRILETSSKDPYEVAGLVTECRAVLVSPRQKQRVFDAIRPETKVIEFVFAPDKTSINNLKVALLELKKKVL